MNKKKISNIVLSAVLALAVIGVGYSAYRQKIQADTIVPGYATLHLGLKITLPEANSIRIKAVALPENGGQRYYFKERDFTFSNSGVNNVEWYIRKIPAGNYKIMVTSSSGAFSPENQSTYLISDTVNERLRFELYLGEEPQQASSPVVGPAQTEKSATPTPTATVTSTTPSLIPEESTTLKEDDNTQLPDIQVPPVPSLPAL